MKSLKPSMREKKRYMKLVGKDLDKNVEKSVLGFIGRLGMAKASLNFIKKGKTSAVVSVNRKSVDRVRASFAVWPEKIEVVKISGTLKGLGK